MRCYPHNKAGKRFHKRNEQHGIHYIENETIVIDGIKIFGSPHTPQFGQWAFMRARNKLEKLWRRAIPEDADIVIWSDNPLSINAKVEYTIVDGQILYSQEKNAELRKRNQQEKARIISKMLADETPKLEKKRFIKKKKGHFHCNTLGEELSTEENHH